MLYDDDDDDDPNAGFKCLRAAVIIYAIMHTNVLCKKSADLQLYTPGRQWACIPLIRLYLPLQWLCVQFTTQHETAKLTVERYMPPSECVSVTLIRELITLKPNQFVADCRKYLHKYWPMSLQWFRSYRVHEISMAIAR